MLYAYLVSELGISKQFAKFTQHIVIHTNYYADQRRMKFMDDELKNKRRINFMHIKKIVNRILTLVLAAIIGFGVGYVTCITKPWEKIGPIILTADDTIVENNYLLTISTVEKIIKPASDLITSEYIYKDADSYENYKQLFGKKVLFTTDKVVFTYKGTVSVGIDLSDVKYDIDDVNKTISIVLPKIGIKSNEIDNSSFEYPFESDSVFNTTSMSDFTELLATLKEKKEEEVKSDTKFMDTARQNTENILENFLTASDATKEYTVIFQ